ncbi:MAG TPA: sulfotransferase family 2 domain-containing protein [Cyclobacteriaceae bacterium]|nr:sulfotransferase family 2 domain-containing protein [Cyclobacteriaceae bacterium]HRJ82888.1 sulfotransferase family 2 domain-containing protein [Cyclobacteriaceae bacterium]
MPHLISLAALVISKSKWSAEPLDFYSWRKTNLAGLENFLPVPLGQPSQANRFSRYPVLTNLIGTAAFVKGAYQKKAGHLIAHHQKLFYVRIPKAASTSLGSEILKLITPDLKTETLTSAQLNFLADAWLQTSLSEPLKTFNGFTVVRNPVDRITSVYRDFFAPDSTKPFIYQNYLGGILPKTLSFDEFIDRINRIPDRFKDQHFKPQHLFVKPYQTKGINIRVFKLEEPGPLQQFLQPFGIILPHLNKSPQTTPVSIRENTLNTIKKMYAFDFEVYGYDQNSAW